jgi:hypothetical protein
MVWNDMAGELLDALVDLHERLSTFNNR